MELKIQNLLLQKNRRIIFISDIHGNLKLFQRLLQKVSFCEEDYLILGGDIIEKGEQNLETLRYVMKLFQRGNVYAVLGNCDSLTEEMQTQSPEEMQQIVEYMIWRNESLFYEFCTALQIPVGETMDLKKARMAWQAHFKPELDFLAGLPHILEQEQFIVAHSGITTKPLWEQDPKQVMKYNGFIEAGEAFDKYVFVGHMPVFNYCDTIGCGNPIFWKNRKIISLDGGNGIRDDGQLNAFVIDNLENMQFSFVSVDDLPQYVVTKPQEASENPIYISWFHNEIEMLEVGEEFSRCRHMETRKELNIPNDFIFGDGEIKHCYDISDYQLPLKSGEIVSLIFRYGNCSYIKKDGELGWISNEKLGKEVR